ncbi:hypothetical protein Tco_0441266 [Tanacetum coccineum]
MLDGTFTSFDEKWKKISDQVNAQFNGNEGGRGLEGIDLNITFESHEIQSESHEIQNESHEIHSESHKIHSESHKIHSESHKIQSESHKIQSESHKIQSGSHEIRNDLMRLIFESHLDILRRLRFKFSTKILLHEINLKSEKMVEFAKEFDKKGPSEKISIIIDAIKNREESDRIDN